MILVITNKEDAHADMVAEEFHKNSIEFFRFNTEDFLVGSKFSFRQNSAGTSGTLSTNQRTLVLDDVLSVWNRRPKKPTSLSHLQDHDTKKFVERESGVVLQGIWNCLVDKFWVNHPRDNRFADNKIIQQKIALELGLRIPDSLITTSPDTAKEFILKYDSVAAKPIYNGFIKRDGDYNIIYTNCLSKKHLENIDSVRYCPTFFQEYIPKLFELRITIIGDKFFVCRIDSQNSSKTKDDWRRYDFDNVQHSEYSIPENIKEKLFSLMSYFNLRFGAIDMIVTPEHEHVFLEINPNGQWGWIQHHTGMQIAKTIADFLAKQK